MGTETKGPEEGCAIGVLEMESKPEKPKRDSYEMGGIVIPPHCPRCGSTEREPYHRVITRAIKGVLPDGFVYTHVSWKHTKCRNCDQKRVDRLYDNKSAKRKPRKRKAKAQAIESKDGNSGTNSGKN